MVASLAQVRHSLKRDVSQLSAAPTGDRPMTLGIGEPFTTTVTVTAILALILSLPVILLQAYGFLMPPFDPDQRRRMLPVTLAIPLLFAAGVAFGYTVVLPAALHFFQNFNSSEFNVLVQASQYYKFAATTLLAWACCSRSRWPSSPSPEPASSLRGSYAATGATPSWPADWWPRCSTEMP